LSFMRNRMFASEAMMLIPVAVVLSAPYCVWPALMSDTPAIIWASDLTSS
jgi:hypothetical protein